MHAERYKEYSSNGELGEVQKSRIAESVSVEVLAKGVERQGSEQAAQTLHMSLEETTSWKNDPNMGKEQRTIVPPTCAQWLSDNLEELPAWQRAPIHGSGSVQGGSSELILHVLHTFQTWVVLSPFESARHMTNQTNHPPAGPSCNRPCKVQTPITI